MQRIEYFCRNNIKEPTLERTRSSPGEHTAATRLACDMYLDTYVRCSRLFISFYFLCVVYDFLYDLFQLLCKLSPVFYLFSLLR